MSNTIKKAPKGGAFITTKRISNGKIVAQARFLVNKDIKTRADFVKAIYGEGLVI